MQEGVFSSRIFKSCGFSLLPCLVLELLSFSYICIPRVCDMLH